MIDLAPAVGPQLQLGSVPAAAPLLHRRDGTHDKGGREGSYKRREYPFKKGDWSPNSIYILSSFGSLATPKSLIPHQWLDVN